jgi:hypothetical protein
MKKLLTTLTVIACIACIGCKKKTATQTPMTNGDFKGFASVNYDYSSPSSANIALWLPAPLLAAVTTDPNISIQQAIRKPSTVVNASNPMNNILIINGLVPSTLAAADRPTLHATMVSQTNGISDMEIMTASSTNTNFQWLPSPTPRTATQLLTEPGMIRFNY